MQKKSFRGCRLALIVAFLGCVRRSQAGISDARFQRLFRVDLANVTSKACVLPEMDAMRFGRFALIGLPWRDWVQKHVQTPNGFRKYLMGASGTHSDPMTCYSIPKFGRSAARPANRMLKRGPSKQ